MGLLKLAVPGCALMVGCVPDVAVDLANVDEPAVLAVRTDPAEAEPGERIELAALFVSEDGALSSRALDWSFCTARVPLAELGPVAKICLDPTTDELLPIAEGALRIAGVVPEDACRLFGPDPPPAEAGEPTGRPVDPDPSGGYYQPVRVQIGEHGDIAFHGVRLSCGLAGADQQQTAEYRQRYQRNLDPRIDTLSVGRSGGAPTVVDSAVPIVVEPAESLELVVEWAACADEIEACTGAETFLRFDPVELELATQREAISIAWYAGDGTFDVARTGRSKTDTETSSTNVFTAPDDPGRVRAWVVARDDRGGVSWIEFQLDVR